MTENIYAPPVANLEMASPDIGEFYIVGKKKFFILFIVTFSLYTLYWFYRNWALQKAANNEDLWPVARAIFPVFFTHSLFQRVESALQAAKREYSWNPSSAASLFVLFAIASPMADRLAARGVGSPYTDVIGFVILPLMAIALYQGQKAINASLGDPNGEANNELTGANWAWLFVFGILWLLTGLGILVILNPELLA